MLGHVLVPQQGRFSDFVGPHPSIGKHPHDDAPESHCFAVLHLSTLVPVRPPARDGRLRELGDRRHRALGYYAYKEELAVFGAVPHLRRDWARPLSHPHRDRDGEVACRLGSSIIKAASLNF